MYDKNENDTINEKLLFKGRPNFFFGCKNIFLLFLVLGVISYLAPIILSFVAEIQVHLVNFIDLPLTTYATFAIIIVFVLILVWMLWIFLNWKATDYIITNYRVVLKEGILIRKSHYMPFNHIQDIAVSQGVIRRIVSIGHVVVVNAYDLTNIEFIDVHNPEDVQELIFTEMNKYYENNQNINERYDYNAPNNSFRDYNTPNNSFRDYNDMDNLSQDDYYQQQNQFNDYQYDDLNFDDHYKRQNHNENNYNYEHYDKNFINQKNQNLNNNDYLNHNIDRAMASSDKNNRFITKKQERNNYQPKVDYNAYKDPNDKFHFSKREEYKENNKIAKNKDNKSPSVIDIYSRKFKKHKK